jgi:hypothetical protein
MYTFGDNSFVQIKINGEEIAVNPSTLLQLQVTENMDYIVPSLKLALLDTHRGLIGKKAVGDGSIIELVLGNDKKADSTKPIRFRVMGMPKWAGEEEPVVAMAAFLDCPKYMRGMPTKSYGGTSAEAIAAIAKDCELEARVPVTNDKQNWLPQAKSNAGMVKNICDHGWASPTSAMVVGLGEDRILRYVDLSKAALEKPIKRFVKGTLKEASDILILETEVKGASGVLNSYAGYGARVVQHAMDGSIVEHTSIAATRLSRKTGVNKELQEKIGISRSVHLPFDCGNTHKNFGLAKHQNLRNRVLYSLDIHVLVDRFSDVHLFDLCEIVLGDASGKSSNGTYSGKYFLTAKARALQGNRYAEKLIFTSQGPNAGDDYT